MATSYKVLGQITPSAASATTLYTVPAATTTIVNSVMIANTDTNNHTFTMSFDGVEWANLVSVPANSVIVFDFKQALAATDTIQGGADDVLVTFHISGVEVA